ncbi:MAG: ATP-binding protein [Ignavibacteriaceae bacterium]|nr:ATP-binding protein [Ignavibacteriaceae bacterium]
MKRTLIIQEEQCNCFGEITSGFDETFYWLARKHSDDHEEIFYSQKIKNITGYTPDEIILMNGRGLELVADEDLNYVKLMYSELEKCDKNKIDIVYRITAKDGKVKYINEKVVYEKKSDNLNVYKGIVTDISSGKNREEYLLKHLEELTQMNHAKDNFISILSHDLRAPFTSILGFTEILLNETYLTEAEKVEYLNYIHNSSANQLQLVNYLLDWSRLQTGRLQIEPVRLLAQGVVFNCVSSLTGNAIRKNIDIKVNINDNIYILADERLLTQAFTNLISNSIKFSQDGKVIEISAERFNEDMIEFVIKDEGVGISPEYQARLFRFEKMFSTSGTKGERGTGLGLPLVKEIIEKHKGQIWFYSEQNEGSEFHFTIPSASNTILLIENITDDYKLFESIIKERFPEFKIVGANNGYEAINYIVKERPTLIVSSHEIPLMNGVQLLKSIHKTDQNFRIPIIIILNRHDESIKKAYDEFGVSAVLSKPVDLDQLIEKIVMALD